MFEVSNILSLWKFSIIHQKIQSLINRNYFLFFPLFFFSSKLQLTMIQSFHFVCHCFVTSTWYLFINVIQVFLLHTIVANCILWLMHCLLFCLLTITKTKSSGTQVFKLWMSKIKPKQLKCICNCLLVFSKWKHTHAHIWKSKMFLWKIWKKLTKFVRKQKL